MSDIYPTFSNSKEMDRRYLGFEIVGDYYAFARERLEQTATRPADPEGIIPRADEGIGL